LGAQWLRGLQNDVFCQVGLVMLVGLSSKNAILIVEFAEQLRQRGMPLVEAAVQAATIRLASDSDDLTGVHPRRGAAGVGHGRGRKRAAFGGHDRVRRDDYVHLAESVLYSGAVLDY
jgi:HAE1 family hydrophobic/amphiphilic exporter-1